MEDKAIRQVIDDLNNRVNRVEGKIASVFGNRHLIQATILYDQLVRRLTQLEIKFARLEREDAGKILSEVGRVRKSIERTFIDFNELRSLVENKNYYEKNFERRVSLLERAISELVTKEPESKQRLIELVAKMYGAEKKDGSY